MKRKNRLSYQRSWTLNSLLFLCPWVIGFFVFFLTPLVNTIWYSFNEMVVSEHGGAEMTFVGFKNFIDLFAGELSSTNEMMSRVLLEENARIFMNAPVILIFSLFLAIILNAQFKGRSAVRLIFFLPIILGMDIVVDMLASTGGDFADAAFLLR